MNKVFFLMICFSMSLNAMNYDVPTLKRSRSASINEGTLIDQPCNKKPRVMTFMEILKDYSNPADIKMFFIAAHGFNTANELLRIERENNRLNRKIIRRSATQMLPLYDPLLVVISEEDKLIKERDIHLSLYTQYGTKIFGSTIPSYTYAITTLFAEIGLNTELSCRIDNARLAQ